MNLLFSIYTVLLTVIFEFRDVAISKLFILNSYVYSYIISQIQNISYVPTIAVRPSIPIIVVIHKLVKSDISKILRHGHIFLNDRIF